VEARLGLYKLEKGVLLSFPLPKNFYTTHIFAEQAQRYLMQRKMGLLNKLLNTHLLFDSVPSTPISAWHIFF
jgi:hypothetical protein